MSYWDTVKTFYRTELGVKFTCRRVNGGWTEVHSHVGSDAPSIFDDSAFGDRYRGSEFRNHLRRHARHAINEVKERMG